MQTQEEILRAEAEEYGKRYVAQRNALFARQIAETIVVEKLDIPNDHELYDTFMPEISGIGKIFWKYPGADILVTNEMVIALAPVRPFGKRKICFENNNILKQEYLMLVKELTRKNAELV